MIVTLTVLFGMFCAAMEALITATLLPTIILDLGQMELYPWIVNGFLLLFIIMTPIFGKLSDTYGYKQMYLVAVAIFLFSSALCGMAQSMPQLILFRSLQGVGTGGMITMSVIFFGKIFTLDQRPKMQALLSSAWAVASLLGPAIGAYLAMALSWRWAFLINIPLASVIFVMIYFFAESKPADDPTPTFDYKGLILFVLGCASFVFGLIQLSQFHVSLLGIFFLCLGILCWAVFVRYSKTQEHPFIPISLFARQEVLLAVMMGFFGGVFLFSTANFMPLYVQGVLGETPRQSSYVITAVAMGSFTGAICSGFLLNRVGFRVMSSCGALSVILGYGLALGTRSQESLWFLVASCYAIGIGISMIANASIIALQAASPKEMLGRATSMFHFFRSFGGLIGVASLGGLQLGVFKLGIEGHPLAETPQKIFDPSVQASFQQESILKVALSNSLASIFICCLVIGIIAWIISFKITSKRPVDYTNHEDSSHV